MEFAKQRYIIKPGAIHVAQQFDLKVTTNSHLSVTVTIWLVLLWLWG
ncbi:Uncharacterised protein [Neisseria gonorrhoeae]|uniref:Uncharacterized protein n=1 Tax=Neisseria gonorrhoeae TaxID=485 RepID=A0A378VWU7_NEIGO|nr:Uncharacterised protein [Neisseria gonorrhoeae]